MLTINTTKLVTIERHISEEQSIYPSATGEFTAMLRDLTLALKIIARDVRRAGLNDILGMTTNTNVHGETVKRLDLISNDIIYRAMDHGGHLCVMASEENEELIPIPEPYSKGKYILVFDPLDGSSNIDVNVTIGTIFAIYQRLDPTLKTDGTVDDVLQPGYKQIAAGYTCYGSSTTLVYTSGHGVDVFTFDPSIGEFFLTFEKVKIPFKGKYYSVNEGNFHKMSRYIKAYIEYLKLPSSDGVRPYSSRYVGSAVADFHRTLRYGGIFMYPSSYDAPDGKLRLLYEANPFSFIMEQAGGMAIDEQGARILDKTPNSIHQRTSFFVGSPGDIEELVSFKDLYS